MEQYTDEMEINYYFKLFMTNLRKVYEGRNTVAAQLQIGQSWAEKPYTDADGLESLPLGSQFQDHVRCFVKPNKKTEKEQYKRVLKLINQLRFVICSIPFAIVTFLCINVKISLDKIRYVKRRRFKATPL